MLRQPGGRMTSVNAAEVVDVMVRARGHPPAAVNGGIDLLVAAGLQIVPLDGEGGRTAGRLRAAHYPQGKL